MTKPTPPQPLFSPAFRVIASVVGALLLGFFIGRLNPGERSPATVQGVTGTSAATAPATENVPAARSAAPEENKPLPGQSTSGPEAAPEAAHDPIGKLRAVSKAGTQFGRIIRAFAITSQLTEKEIPGVLAYAESLNGEEREVMLIGALARWTEFDPAAAAEWTRTRKPGSGSGARAETLELSLAEWAARDAVSARAWIDRLDDPQQRESALRGYISGLVTQNPAAALRELEKLPPDGKDQRTYNTIFSAWASQDPRAAAAAAAGLGDEKARQAALGAVANAWARQAPREVLAWAQQLTNKDDQRRCTRDALGIWAGSDPQAAMAQLLSLPPELRDEAAKQVVEVAARRDFDEARRMAEQLPPGAGRDRAISVIVSTLAGRDPRAAAEVAKTLPEGAAAEIWATVADRWMQVEPTAAAQWVTQLPDGPGRSGAVRNVIDRWVKTDPSATAQWVERLPAGISRDEGAAAFARQVRNADPANAMEWAASVSNLKQREATVRQVLDTWQKKDPAAAKAWLESTNVIGADLRSVLLRTP